jgi:hypothetical protein
MFVYYIMQMQIKVQFHQFAYPETTFIRPAPNMSILKVQQSEDVIVKINALLNIHFFLAYGLLAPMCCSHKTQIKRVHKK